ncbi:MAG: DUF721 domain-containing protein [Acidimicrobiales bacterium]
MSTWRPDADREPQRIGGSLDSVAARLGGGSARGLGGLYERWEDVVGEAAAAHARPGPLRQGRLVIEVDHPAWATSLAHLEATLLRRLAEVAGPGVVKGVDVRVRPR